MKRCDGFVKRRVGAHTVLVPIGRYVLDLNGLVTLNETGAFLWDLLADDRSGRELAEALANEFSVDYDTASVDVASFTRHLSSMGLLQG